MVGWLGTRKDRSAASAKDRLKLVLIQDRTSLSFEKLEKMKNELIEVISKYVTIDISAVKIQMTQEGRAHRLVADIPLKGTSKRFSG
jgi:cell division topological specificity factor